MISITLSNLIKNIYLLLPLKNVFKLIRRLNLSKRFYWYLRFRGNFTVHIDEKHRFKIRSHGSSIENSIFWAGMSGDSEKTSMKLWLKLIQDAEVIFDVGANTGIYSLVTKAMKPLTKVFAFEPVQRIYKKLQYNNQLNGFDIVCVPYAAANSNGTAIIYDLPAELPTSVTINKDFFPEGTRLIPIQIETIRLDTFIDQQEVQRLDLIKIDVETYEPEVLEGFGISLDKFRPTLLIEVLNDVVGNRIEGYLKNKNYLFFNINEESGSVKHVQHITKSETYNYLICTASVATKLNLSWEKKGYINYA